MMLDKSYDSLSKGLGTHATAQTAEVLSHSVVQNLGDQLWIAASDEADFKLEESRYGSFSCRSLLFTSSLCSESKASELWRTLWRQYLGKHLNLTCRLLMQ